MSVMKYLVGMVVYLWLSRWVESRKDRTLLTEKHEPLVIVRDSESGVGRSGSEGKNWQCCKERRG